MAISHTVPCPETATVPALPQTLATYLAALEPVLAPIGECDAPQLVDQVTALQELSSYLIARQARVVHEAAERSAQESAELAENPRRKAQRHNAMCSQIALARKTSPTAASRFVAFASLLVDELPQTLEALTTGTITEWAATEVVKEISHLPIEDRWLVDQLLTGQFHGKSPAHLVAVTHQIACEINQEAIVGRNNKAVAQRRVSLRPAADGMSILTAILPMAQGVAAWAVLKKAAVSAKTGGDTRTEGQLMTDSLVAALTTVFSDASSLGVATTAPAAEGVVPAHRDLPVGTGVVINLLMTDTALFGRSDTPAMMAAAGLVPAAIPAVSARDLIANAPPDITIWLRRLYTKPETGQLISMDSKQRLFPASLREFVILRDQRCRTPWCGAPIREIDHIVPHHRGGPTSSTNGQGYCTRCNKTKEAAGWRLSRDTDGTITTRTPTGHTYDGREPSMRGGPPSRPTATVTVTAPRDQKRHDGTGRSPRPVGRPRPRRRQ